jgi:hypothetical protein
VSCATTTSCVAVGSRDQQPLIEEWHGSTWTIAASPSPAGTKWDFLAGVDALNDERYVAVGRSHTEAYVRTLLEQNF